ncbi:MAG: protein kinase domain-containing protein [Myxococcota bacterium]
MRAPCDVQTASLDWLILALFAAGAAAALLVWWRRRETEEERETRQARADIVEGRYHLAVPWLLEHGRIAEAARLEALRGHTDRAAALYEQAGDVRGAASVYLTLGDFDMAALVFKEGGLRHEAADAFAHAGRHEAAAALFEDLGALERALESWRAAGDGARVAALLEQLGRGDDAERVRARSAEMSGRWAEAAALWEQVGDAPRAIEAWAQAGKPTEAARILLGRGKQEAAAPLLERAGEYEAAAEAWARARRYTEAARAYYRAGRVTDAVRLLTLGEDWLPLARIYLQHGREAAAHDALLKVPTDDERWEEAQMLLLELYRRGGQDTSTCRVLEQLVARRRKVGPLNDDVRRWTVHMAEILFRHGKETESLMRLRSLGEVGLMTPELERQIQAVEHPRKADGARGELPSTLGLPEHDRYEFVEKLGEGGNGVIYRAVDKTLGRQLAIKMIGQTALPSDVAKRFFLREAQTAARLNHPGIVTIYDMGEIEGRSYIAMELIDGESLADRLAGGSGRISPEALMPIVQSLCSALDYAHERGVIHRDVKLENVMLSRDGSVKLMDFGLAKAIHGSPDRTLMITGTPLYMSPEQIAGEDVDHRTDIYALGVMVFRLLTGRWPYFDDDVLDQHQHSPVPDPCQANPDLPAGFRDLIQRAMAKDRQARYARAGELCRAMRAAIHTQ